MTEFYSETIVKKTRKAHRCDGCCKMIEVGSEALRYSGKFGGDFGSFIHHPECRAAECALNKRMSEHVWDDWIPLSDIDPDDYPWLLATFPSVAARFNITAETIAEEGNGQ